MDHDVLTMINEIIGGKGGKQYGLSAINQRAHALQFAWLAEKARGSAALITASLLHDIGHMVHDLGEDPASEGIDDKHEKLGEAWLARWFGPDVTEPVRLHVAAKRYLCAAEPDYFAKLSSDSVRSPRIAGWADERIRNGGIPRQPARGSSRRKQTPRNGSVAREADNYVFHPQ